MCKKQLEKHVDKFDIVIDSAEKKNYLNFSILSTEIWKKIGNKYLQVPRVHLCSQPF